MSYGGMIVQSFVTLLAVCALAFAALVLGKRVGVGRARGPIRLVGQLPLDARRSIYLVRVGGQVLVVGASEGGFTKLGEVLAAELPREDDPAFATSPAFAEVLARALGRKGAGRARDD
jgi:flagellar protein FliO/FliZ